MSSDQSDKKSVRYLNTTHPSENWWQSGPFPELLSPLFRVRWIIATIIGKAGTAVGLLHFLDWKVAAAFAAPAVLIVVLTVEPCRASIAL